MRNRVRDLMWAAALVAPSMLCAPAFAQDADVSTEEEIVVTANKREQNLQDVAAAISAFSGENLEERGITDPADLQFIVPSLVVGKSQGNTAFTFRGVGFNTVGAPAVAVHVDGVYQPYPSMGDLAQIDIERVEVLRGPQGTLYGRNANGGVVNFLSRRPTDEFEGYLRAGYASYDETLLEGVLNVPLGENTGVRVLLSHNDRREGFVENVAGGPDYLDGGHDGIRVAFDTAFTDALSLELTASYIERDGAVYPSIAQDQPTTAGDGPRGAPFGDLFPFGGDIYAALGATWTGEPNRTTANDPAGSDRVSTVVSAVLNWDLNDNFTLRSVTGYQDYKDHHWSDFDGSSASIYLGRILRDSETWTQELNLSGRIGPVDAVFGVFYMDDTFTQDLSITEPNGNGAFQPPALLSFVTGPYESETTAVFTDLTWNVTDDFRLVGGVRRSQDVQNNYQDFRIDATIQVAPGTFINLGQQCLGSVPELKFNSTTPRFGAEYDVTEDSLAYITYSEGFKVGGYNTGGTCNDAYLPEEIEAIEIGLRNTFFDGRLNLNATAFSYDYTNLQLQQIIGVGVDIINAPGAEVTGFELEASWAINENWAIFGNLALLDAEYTDFTNVDGAVNNGANPPVDLSGNKLNSAPETTIQYGFDYWTGNVIAGGSLRFRADAAYRSDYFLREFNTVPEERQDGFTVFNASLTWRNADEDFAIRLYGTNLTDEEYLTQLQWSAPTSARTISWGEPRQYGIEIRKDF